MTEKHLTDQKFSSLDLTEEQQRGLQEAGFEFCTPIQAQSLPYALQGKDVAGQAQTGTGKTIAFLLACCQTLLTKAPREGYQKGEPRALILVPTRELAIQIHKDALLLNKYTGLSIGLVYGGTGYEQQKTMLAGNNDILVGTPGRLIDFYKQGLFSLSFADVAVMDEADRMFDLGFIKDIRYLLRKMPAADDRLNLLFSATLSFRVMELAYEHMNDPVEIKVESDEVVADKVTESSYYPADDEKLRLLVNLLNQSDPERVLVFVNTRYIAEHVARTLSANGHNSATLSGDVPQNKREHLLEQFKQGKRKVLVATDVAARGLHIPAVSHVYNYDLPQDAEDYVHRIGRTARAGASGEAISFVCEKYAYSIMDIEEYIGHSLPRIDVSSELLAEITRGPARPPRERYGKGREHGDRKSGANRSAKSGQGRGRWSRDETTQPESRPEAVTESVTHHLPQENLQNAEVAVTQVTRDLIAESEKQSDFEQTAETAGDREPSKVSSFIMPASTNHPPRFSRRFGEIPVIG